MFNTVRSKAFRLSRRTQSDMSGAEVFQEKYKYVYQSEVVFGATLFNLGAFLSIGWSSPSFPKLMAPGGPVLITVHQGAWILSTMRIASLLIPIPAAWMTERFGRKKTLLSGAIPLLCGWLTLTVADTFEQLVLFAFLVASASGIANVVLPMYIAEISTAHIRGYLGVVFTVMAKLGLLLMYSIGPFLSVRTTAWLSMIPVCLFLVIYSWLPESPYHLIAHNKDARAERSLQKLRCRQDVKEELLVMESSVKESQENQGFVRELFYNSRNLRSSIVVLGLTALLNLSGSQIVLQYAQTIFATLNSELDVKYASIIFGFVQLCSTILACFLVDTLGRRPLLLISITGSGLCTAVIAVYYILERHMDVTGLGWIPLTAIMVFMVSYSTGMLPLMYVITSELFPKNLRNVAGAMMSINSNFVGLLMIFGYQYVLENWGSDYVFMAFSLMTFAFIPFVWFLVPETRRKTLETIQKETTTKRQSTREPKYAAPSMADRIDPE